VKQKQQINKEQEEGRAYFINIRTTTLEGGGIML
jgi:hypothetical protein